MKSKKRNGYLIFVTVLLYISFGLLTSVIGVIIDKFKVDYNVSLSIAALLPFAFFLAYGLTSIPFGLAMDRFKAKSILLLGTLMMALGSFLLYASNHYLVVVLMIFVIGVGVTGIQIAGNPFIRELDKPTNYNRNLTAIIGIGSLGYAASPLIVPIVQAGGYSWNSVYLLFGVLNILILGLLLFARFPDVEIDASERIQLSKIKALLKDPIILAYALGIFMYVGAEVGVSSYILTYMDTIHGIGSDRSWWPEGSFWNKAFPSITALAVGVFWLLQSIGRLVVSFLMKYFSERSIFVFHSIGTVIALLVAMYATSANMALFAFVMVGYFTCASFTAIFSAAINSFESNHGTISGILGTAIVGGAFIGWLVGVAGEHNMRWGMWLNVLAFLYVVYLAIWGKGKLDISNNSN